MKAIGLGIIASSWRPSGGGGSGRSVWINCTNLANSISLSPWQNVGIDITPYDLVDTTGVATPWQFIFTEGDGRIDNDTFSPPTPENPDYPDAVSSDDWTTGPGIPETFSLTGADDSKTYDIEVYVYDGTGNNNGDVTFNSATHTFDANTPSIYTFSGLIPSGGVITGQMVSTTNSGADYGTMTAFKITESV